MKRIREENCNTPEFFDKCWEGDLRKRLRQFDMHRFHAMKKPIRNGDRVIELACGCSEFLSYAHNFNPKGEFWGCDYSKWAMKYMPQVDPRVKWVYGDIFTHPIPKCSFDVVCAGEIIEHLEKPETLAYRMAELAKPKGTLVITTLLPDLQARDQAHIWKFEPSDLEKMFSRVGRAEVVTVGNYFVVTTKKGE